MSQEFSNLEPRRHRDLIDAHKIQEARAQLESLARLAASIGSEIQYAAKIVQDGAAELLEAEQRGKRADELAALISAYEARQAEATKRERQFETDLAGARSEVEALERAIADLREQLSASENQIKALEVALETAERNRERFRYALFVYLQERDGPAGTKAPTPETLTLIRKILEEEG